MYKNIEFKELRILPMSVPDELAGHSIEEVQEEYFLKGLVNNNGEYSCHENDLHIYGKVLVLFQYSNSIVAAGILDKVVELNEIHDAKYYFEADSISVFNPISSDEMMKMFRIRELSEAKQRLELSKKKSLMDILTEKGIVYKNFQLS